MLLSRPVLWRVCGFNYVKQRKKKKKKRGWKPFWGLKILHSCLHFQSVLPEGAPYKTSPRLLTALLTTYLQIRNTCNTGNFGVSFCGLKDLYFLLGWNHSHFMTEVWKAMPATDAHCHWSKLKAVLITKFESQHENDKFRTNHKAFG